MDVSFNATGTLQILWCQEGKFVQTLYHCCSIMMLNNTKKGQKLLCITIWLKHGQRRVTICFSQNAFHMENFPIGRRHIHGKYRLYSTYKSIHKCQFVFVYITYRISFCVYLQNSNMAVDIVE